MNYKIYALKEPNTDVIKYVGITKKDLQQRLYSHLHTHTSKGLDNWFDYLKSKNLIPEIILLEEFEGENTNKKEVFYMNKYKNTILNKNFKIHNNSYIETEKYFSTFKSERKNNGKIS